MIDGLFQGQNELIATSAPIQDEAIQAILGWTQTHPNRALLFSSSFAQGFFSLLLDPKVFPPTYLPPPT